VFTGLRLFLDGEAVPRSSWIGTSYALPDGRSATLSGAWTRTSPTVEIEGTIYETGEAIPLPLVVLQFLPVGLVGVGGLLGGVVGGLGFTVNMAILRSTLSTPVRAAGMLGVLAASVGVWLAVLSALGVVLGAA
jgi:hypothetical protein